MRNITKTLTVMSLLAPVSGHALGIGDIRVHSALNQNLNAEIHLVTSRGENPSSIKVNLAPADKFDEAGVPWSYFLSKIKFKTIVKPNGSVVVKVTSHEALKEPYLNFLVEVSWPKGNLYREFTVLVDPPAEYEQPAYQEPEYSYVEPSYPIRRTNTGNRRQKSDYQPPRRRAVRPAAKPRRSPAVSQEVYGDKIVTRRNDTLWKVASRVRGSGVSVEQMMMAIYDQNPHAFFAQNVNALSAGKTIKVPEKGVAQQLSRQEALDEFARHNSAWNNNRSGVPSSANQATSQETADNQLKLEAPSESSIAANESVTPSSEQNESTKGETTQPAGNQQASSTEKGTGASAAKPPVDEALQSKIAALEKQMATMQELIALKDKQLAELQNPGSTTASTTTPPEIAPTETAPKVTPPVPEQAPVKTEKQEQQKQDTTAQPTEPAPSQAQQTPQTTSEKPVQPPATVKPTPKPRPVIKAPTPSKTSDDDAISPVVWIFGGLGALILPLFGWLWWQKKKILAETEAESMFRSYSTLRTPDTTSGPLTSMTRKPVSTISTGESSFLNEFKTSDFESFESFNVDHGDIDPIEEADVYLAYGRYQQAEDLIKQAIKADPSRDECKLKLLEIYRASGSKNDFENFAIELAANGKQEDKDFWRKVSELGKEICPESSLFALAAPSVAVFPTDFETHAESVLFEINPNNKPVESSEHAGVAEFSIPESTAEEVVFDVAQAETPIKSPEPEIQPAPPVTKASSPETPAENELEFDLNAFEENFADLSDNDILDFDLGPYPGSTESKPELFDLAEKQTSELSGSGSQDTALTSDHNYEALDFDFNMDKLNLGDSKLPGTEFVTESKSDAWDPEQTIDFSFDTPEKEEADGESMIDINFDIDPSMISANKPSYQETDFGVSDLTDMDEIETKLDLAKAYIDMGDTASAKDIIGQVLEKGSPEQKRNAMALLDEINLG